MPPCVVVTQQNTDSSEMSRGKTFAMKKGFRNQLGMSSACVCERVSVKRFPGVLIGPERALTLTMCGLFFKTKPTWMQRLQPHSIHLLLVQKNAPGTIIV